MVCFQVQDDSDLPWVMKPPTAHTDGEQVWDWTFKLRGSGPMVDMEDRNVWNSSAGCLSSIKSEYGRNATLKRLG